MELMRHLQDLDQLEQALQEAMRTGQLENVDPEKLAELLGEDARRAWEELDRMRQLLQDAGYITADDKMDLTARGIRRIGQKALREVFAHLKKDRLGHHVTHIRGANGDLLGDTKAYEFEDPFQLDLQATVKNAILRNGPEVPVRFSPQYFEFYRDRHLTRAAPPRPPETISAVGESKMAFAKMTAAPPLAMSTAPTANPALCPTLRKTLAAPAFRSPNWVMSAPLIQRAARYAVGMLPMR